jgi:hypothetical protein
MRRCDLVDRLYAEAERWAARPPRSDADRAAYAVYVECLRLVDVGAVLDATRDLLDGRPDDYLKRRPCDDET